MCGEGGQKGRERTGISTSKSQWLPPKDLKPLGWITDYQEKQREGKGERDSPAGVLCNGDNRRLPARAPARVSASHVHKGDSCSQRNTETSASGASWQHPSCSRGALQRHHAWPTFKAREYQALLKKLQLSGGSGQSLIMRQGPFSQTFVELDIETGFQVAGTGRKRNQEVVPGLFSE